MYLHTIHTYKVLTILNNRKKTNTIKKEKIPLLSIYPNTNIHYSARYKSQDMETTQKYNDEMTE